MMVGVGGKGAVGEATGAVGEATGACALPLTRTVADPAALAPAATAEAIFVICEPGVADALARVRISTDADRCAVTVNEQESCLPASVQSPPIRSVMLSGSTKAGKVSSRVTFSGESDDV